MHGVHGALCRGDDDDWGGDERVGPGPQHHHFIGLISDAEHPLNKRYMMNIEQMTHDELWAYIYNWADHRSLLWSKIKPLVGRLDATRASHKAMLSHIMRVAVEHDQVEFLKEAMADNIPVFDADFAKLRVGPTHYSTELLEVVDQDTVHLQLNDVPVQRVVVPYEPIASSVSIIGGNYYFKMSYESPSTGVITSYVRWFRAFFEHHVMNNQPHHIPDDELERYNQLIFRREESMWVLQVFDSHPFEHEHASAGKYRFFIL